MSCDMERHRLENDRLVAWFLTSPFSHGHRLGAVEPGKLLAYGGGRENVLRDDIGRVACTLTDCELAKIVAD